MNLTNNFIKSFKFLISVFILFLKKSNYNLKLFVNFCDFNHINIKNKYLLLLIKKFLKWL